MEIQCILEGIQTNRSIWQKIKDDNVAKELSKSRKNSSDEISKGGAVLPPLPIALGKTSSTPNLKSESSVDKKLSGKANNSTFVASDRPEKDARKLSIFGLKKDKGVMK